MGCTSSTTASSPQKARMEKPVITVEEANPDDRSNNDGKRLSRRVKTALPGASPAVELAEVICELSGHSSGVDVCAWSPRSDCVVTAASDRRAFVWHDAATERSPKRVEVPLAKGDSACCAAWDKDGKTVAVGTEHGYVLLVSTSGKLIDSYRPQETAVKCVRMQSDFVLSAGHVVCVFSRSTRRWTARAWNAFVITDVEWISSKQFVVADAVGGVAMDTIEDAKYSKVSDDTLAPVDSSPPDRTFVGHVGGVYRVARHPSRPGVFASASLDCNVCVWSVDRHTPSHTLKGHFGYVVDVLWLDSGRKRGSGSDLLASASFDGAVRVWNAATGECVRIMDAHQGPVATISVTPDGRFLASGGHDGLICLWAIRATDNRRSKHNSHKKRRNSNGIYSSSSDEDEEDENNDGGLLGPNRSRAHPISVFEGRARMLRVAFDSEGVALAAASADGAVTVFRVKRNSRSRYHTS